MLWLRRDLRRSDLPALNAARAEVGPSGQVLVCFAVDPRLEKSTGPRRFAFLCDSLRDVNAGLDGALAVVRGRPEVEIPRLAAAVDASSVHISADFSPFGRRRDAAVAEALGDIPLVATGSPYLISPGRVTKDDGDPYKVFTPYFRRWRDHGWRGPAVTEKWGSGELIDPDDVRGVERIAIPDSSTALPFPAGEAAAHEQWARFVDEDLPGYAARRDRPSLEATSLMSAHLKFGTIHPRTLAADLARVGPSVSDDAQAYLRELAFRDFYADVLYHWPDSLWHNWHRGFDDIELDSGDDALARFDAWKAGRTGFGIVDAGMRQLAETGFMHNRVRMIAASFLVKDLHLPWWWGARWFLDQLVDGDTASNQHGWQWAAGTGTDAAPYFRVFNPTAQAKRFDPDGVYIRRWVPEYGGPDYPDPIVDHKAEREEALRRYRSL